MKGVIALVVVLIHCGPIPAQYSDPYSECLKKADTQLAMQGCAKEEALRSDAELNNSYQKLLSAAGKQAVAVEKIKAAEKAWVAYRDAYVDAMYAANDKQAAYGSLFPMEATLLRAKLTREHVEALKDLMKQYGASR